jgi:hypothetical protein
MVLALDRRRIILLYQRHVLSTLVLEGRRQFASSLGKNVDRVQPNVCCLCKRILAVVGGNWTSVEHVRDVHNSGAMGLSVMETMSFDLTMRRATKRGHLSQKLFLL